MALAPNAALRSSPQLRELRQVPGKSKWRGQEAVLPSTSDTSRQQKYDKIKSFHK
jgi:hypothetical protein